MSEAEPSPAASAEPSAETPTAGAPRAKPPIWPVVRTMLSFLRRYGVRMFLLSVATRLLGGLAAVLLGSLGWAMERTDLAQGLPSLLALILFVVLWYCGWALMAGPLFAGYQYAGYRLLANKGGSVRALFAGYRCLRLYMNLVSVSAAGFLSAYALSLLWTYLPWDFCWEYFDNIVTLDSPVAWILWSIPGMSRLISSVHVWAQALILLPIQWAALEVIVAGRPWHGALASSARLVLRHRRLALIAFGALVFLSFDDWVRALLPRGAGYAGDMKSLVEWLNLAGNGAISVAKLALETTALVVVYREMLRGGRPVSAAESAGDTEPAGA